MKKKRLLQKQDVRYNQIKELLRSYNDLESRLKTLKEKNINSSKLNVSKTNCFFFERNLLQTTQIKYSTNKTIVD